MKTSEKLMPVSLFDAEFKLEKVLSSETKPIKIEMKNMAVGIIADHDTGEKMLRDLAFVYLQGTDYWLVKMDGSVDKISSLSIGDYLVLMYFVVSLPQEMQIDADANHKYILCRDGEDVIIYKNEY